MGVKVLKKSIRENGKYGFTVKTGENIYKLIYTKMKKFYELSELVPGWPFLSRRMS